MLAARAANFSTTSRVPPPIDVHYQRGTRVPYRDALVWQRWVQRRLFERNTRMRGSEGVENLEDKHVVVSDALFLVEHDPVYTLGRRSTLDNLLFDPDSGEHDIVRVERGGEVTWHGPGQLVGYPIFALADRKKDLHWFLRQIEEVVIRVLASYDLEGVRSDAGTGVWVGDNKIAAIGLSASKWVSMHGFSINVDPDLGAFRQIVPCGIEGRGVTSLALEMQKRGRSMTGKVSEKLSINTVAEETVRQFVQVFNQQPGSMVWRDYPKRNAISPKDLWEESTLPIHR